MKNTKKILNRIKTANKEQLKSIERLWSKIGGKFDEKTWPVILSSITNRRLELDGINPYSDPF